MPTATGRYCKPCCLHCGKRDMAGVVWNQTVIMALYMALGFGLYKAGKITQEGSRALGTLLLWLVLPAVILDSFCVQFSPDRLEQLGTSALLGVLALGIALCVARLLYPEAPIDNFSAAFSNAGFMGIPLVREALGGEAVFYLVAMITLLNILQWTYGAAVLRRQPFRPHLRNLVGNPLFVAGIAGLAVFVTGIGGRMPSLVQSAVNGISALNAPLAMLVLGIYLAQTRLRDLVVLPRLYAVSAVRLLLIPALTILAFLPLPVQPTVKLAVLLAAAAPVGANVAVYAQQFELDYPYACQTVAHSTLFSLATLPVISILAAGVFQI